LSRTTDSITDQVYNYFTLLNKVFIWEKKKWLQNYHNLPNKFPTNFSQSRNLRKERPFHIQQQAQHDLAVLDSSLDLIHLYKGMKIWRMGILKFFGESCTAKVLYGWYTIVRQMYSGTANVQSYGQRTVVRPTYSCTANVELYGQRRVVRPT
jgi:hypothetical protein